MPTASVPSPANAAPGARVPILRPALVLFVLLTVVLCAIYPLVVTGGAKALFPRQAAGSLLVVDGKPVGSALIGQSFTEPRWFWGRPSATAESPYNPKASGGSNLGARHPTLAELVRSRVVALRTADPGNTGPVPQDLVTASASGLDPHISPEAARYQAGRVARVRNLPPERVAALVDQHIEGRWLGLFGEPRVNVLLLNLALERSN